MLGKPTKQEGFLKGLVSQFKLEFDPKKKNKNKNKNQNKTKTKNKDKKTKQKTKQNKTNNKNKTKQNKTKQTKKKHTYINFCYVFVLCTSYLQIFSSQNEQTFRFPTSPTFDRRHVALTKDLL